MTDHDRNSIAQSALNPKQQFTNSFMKYLEDLYGPCDSNPECDSPIEAMFYQSVSLCASMKHLVLTVNTQHKIEDYRVDFFITARETCAACMGVLFERSVIVECDGHEFHERTKEQASKDKKRDRILQQLGYNVFRFTGSDIWKDVFSCGNEVIGFLSEEIEKQSIDHWIARHRAEEEK